MWMKTGERSICYVNKAPCTHVFQLRKYFYEKQLLITIEKSNISAEYGRGRGFRIISLNLGIELFKTHFLKLLSRGREMNRFVL